MGEVYVCAIGPASSMGSPITFMMRPKVAGPTGTRMGPPVSVTTWPRTRPSVESIAIARTVFSPRCWATSNTRRTVLPVRASTFVVSSAFRIAGRLPSNCTSTTAPMICVRRPLELGVCAFMAVSFSKRSNGRSAGDDLNQLLGDLRLAGAVHLNGKRFDEVACVARGAVHCGHLCGEEAGLVFQERGQDLDGDVLGQQCGEDFILVGLVIIDGARGFRIGGFDGGRNELHRSRRLRHNRFEAAVNQSDDVDLAGFGEIEDRLRDGARQRKARRLDADLE